MIAGLTFTGMLLLGLISGSFLSILIGLLGSRRRIGFGWAFLASLILTPIVGLIITLLSDPLPYGASRRMGCLGTTFGFLGLILLLFILVTVFLLFAGIV